MQTISPGTMRQSGRVAVRMDLEVSWVSSAGTEIKEAAHTLLVSRNGGVLRVQEKLFSGQEITLHRKVEDNQTKTARARIVAEIDHEPEGFLYAFAISDPRLDFWNIEFP